MAEDAAYPRGLKTLCKSDIRGSMAKSEHFHLHAWLVSLEMRETEITFGIEVNSGLEMKYIKMTFVEQSCDLSG